MTTKRQFDSRKLAACVGVISSNAELHFARRMRSPPDFFELRLDYMCHLRDADIDSLKRPLILTARSAAEGGANNLTDAERRNLMLRFLSRASLVDSELRSIPRLQQVWDQAQRRKVGRICSVHDASRTPRLPVLLKYLDRAVGFNADVFKLVTKADSVDELSTLLDFLRHKGSRIERCVMATGKFGPISRVLFPECGSALVYAPLRKVFHDGQLTLDELRTIRDFYPKR